MFGNITGDIFIFNKQEGGELVKLKLQRTRRDFSYNGTAYSVYLEWAEDEEGCCALGYVELPNSVAGQYAVLQFVPGTGEKLLLLLDGKYPVIIDLHEDTKTEINYLLVSCICVAFADLYVCDQR